MEGMNYSDSRWGYVAGCCECGNEPSGSIKSAAIFCLVEDLTISEEGLCTMKLLSQLFIVSVSRYFFFFFFFYWLLQLTCGF
jgi:hypothetical protein